MPSGVVAGEQGLLPPKFLPVGKFSSCQKIFKKASARNSGNLAELLYLSAFCSAISLCRQM